MRSIVVTGTHPEFGNCRVSCTAGYIDVTFTNSFIDVKRVYRKLGVSTWDISADRCPNDALDHFCNRITLEITIDSEYGPVVKDAECEVVSVTIGDVQNCKLRGCGSPNGLIAQWHDALPDIIEEWMTDSVR
jgi:hypothetical protein